MTKIWVIEQYSEADYGGSALQGIEETAYSTLEQAQEALAALKKDMPNGIPIDYALNEITLI